MLAPCARARVRFCAGVCARVCVFARAPLSVRRGPGAFSGVVCALRQLGDGTPVPPPGYSAWRAPTLPRRRRSGHGRARCTSGRGGGVTSSARADIDSAQDA